MKASSRVFHVAADYRLWPSASKTYTIQRRRNKNLLDAASAPAFEQLIIHQHRGNHRRRSAARHRMNSPAPSWKNGGPLPSARSGWRKGRRSTPRKWIAGHCGMPNDAGRTGGTEADRRPEESFWIFLNARCPATWRPLEFCWRGRVRGRTTAGRRKRAGRERYLLGGENLTLKQMLDTLAKITVSARSF